MRQALSATTAAVTFPAALLTSASLMSFAAAAALSLVLLLPQTR